MSKPVAVLISDIHYNISTLPFADAATRMAVAKANELIVPLVVAGDLHDTKAAHRAECQEAMLNTFAEARIDPIILVGNHCRRHEKSPEHALHFLKGIASIVSSPVTWDNGSLTATLIPYQSTPQEFTAALTQSPPGIPIICHQGLLGANMGHYIQDKSAVTRDDVADFRVISGHYHRRQDIKCGRPRKGAVGLFSYIGNPFTLTFGESEDPDKGFQILHDNGLLEFVPTNLRRHIIIEGQHHGGVLCLTPLQTPPGAEDLVWIKIKGSSAELAKINKEEFGLKVLGHSNYRLEKILVGGVQTEVKSSWAPAQLMDTLVDNAEEELETRASLKKLWRELSS